jgi:hypothetical protein
VSLTDAVRRIDGIRDVLGQKALRLAYHAALPVVMDAELLNLLRVNFFLDPPDDLPYEVEASLLLSSLFREIGEGLYEIEPGLRNLLLSGLQRDYGEERVRRVAALLEQYTDASVAWRGWPELDAAQRLTAVSFLDPPLAEEWLSGGGPGADTRLDHEWYVAMRRRIDEQSAVPRVGDGVVLRLSGLPVEEAMQEADALLDIRGPLDLSRLVVVDDTALLVQHSPVYERLDTSRRVEWMLCVAVGPRVGDRQGLDLAGNLGGGQGHGVLWVSDPRGIDWRVAVTAIAGGHPAGPVSGLEHLIELLSVDEIFDSTYEALELSVPGRVASPGLKLAGADDEAAIFAAVLAMAIRVVTGKGTGTDGPFPALLPDATGGAGLNPGGPLVRHRDEVARRLREAESALDKMSGLGGLFSRAGDDFRGSLIVARGALVNLRDLVAYLLSGASTTGELSGRQRQLLLDAGLTFPGQDLADAEQPAIDRVVAGAAEDGATLASISRRLAETERAVVRRGSAAYLPQIEQLCPAGLLDLLGNPPQRSLRRASAKERQVFGLTEASRAAQGLTDLIVEVANREWSDATPVPAELARVRIALDGARKGLEEYAGTAGDDVGIARLRRLSESLLPMLRELVQRIVAAELTSPSASEQDAFAAARDRATALLADWVRSVHANGLYVSPPFANSTVQEVPFTVEDGLARVREALSYPAAAEMWQLCGPEDLGVLDVSVPPLTVRFAPRLLGAALAGLLPEQPVWTSSGSFAGLLRLVALRPGVVISSWGEYDG